MYPSRTPKWRAVTIALGIVWGVALLVMVWQLPVISTALLWGSLVFPAYYVLLSLAVGWRR